MTLYTATDDRAEISTFEELVVTFRPFGKGKYRASGLIAVELLYVPPEGWLPAVRYLIEELGADVNARDHNGYNAVHHAASRGDNELILYLVSKGGDVMAIDCKGRTTVDMANGPQQRVQPIPETIKLLEGLGAKNNHNCVSC